jgi:diguanylate cyclase (GGDEF)-like protein
LAFVDIDDFKAINDRCGHATGDDILRRMSAAMLAAGRPGDLQGRLGGDEFVIAALLPVSDALFGTWSERLQQSTSLDLEQTRVTASVGSISVRDPGTSPDAALHRADQAMYKRKAERRGGP